MNSRLIAKDLRELLARNIRAERAVLGVSQEEFAHRIGMSARYLASLEQAEKAATVDTLHKLAVGFGVMPWRLLFDESAVGGERRKAISGLKD